MNSRNVLDSTVDKHTLRLDDHYSSEVESPTDRYSLATEGTFQPCSSERPQASLSFLPSEPPPQLRRYHPNPIVQDGLQYTYAIAIQKNPEDISMDLGVTFSDFVDGIVSSPLESIQYEQPSRTNNIAKNMKLTKYSTDEVVLQSIKSSRAEGRRLADLDRSVGMATLASLWSTSYQQLEIGQRTQGQAGITKDTIDRLIELYSQAREGKISYQTALQRTKNVLVCVHESVLVVMGGALLNILMGLCQNRLNCTPRMRQHYRTLQIVKYNGLQRPWGIHQIEKWRCLRLIAEAS